MAASLVVAAGAAAVAVAALTARFLPVTNHLVLIVAALSPYLCVGAAVAAGILLATRRWWSAAAAVTLTAAAVAVQVPQFRAGPAPDGVPVRVLTANLREGGADPAALAGVAGAGADVLVVQELTADLAARLEVAGLGSTFPYQLLDARPVAAGVGIWSRFPVREYSRIGGFELGVISATLRVPRAAVDAVVLAVHIVGPWPQPIDGWRSEWAAMPATLRQISAGAGPAAVIAAGDFNATADMAPFRALLDGGFASATAQSGAGLVPTFPADATVPPLIGIDHILVANSVATQARSVRIPGSDHLGLLATVHLPRS